MPGMEPDLSSFNQPLPVGPFDQARNMAATRSAIQGNISNDISIDKQKLDLINQHMGIANHELSILANEPDLNQAKVQQALDRLAKTTNMPPAVYQKMHEEYATAGNDPAKLKQMVDMNLRRGMSVQEQLNNQYSIPTVQSNGQQDVPVGVSQQKGTVTPLSVAPSLKPAFQRQAPPTTETVDNQRTLPDGRPNPNFGGKGLLGPRPSELPAALPVAPRTTGPTGPTVRRPDLASPPTAPGLPVNQPDFNSRFSASQPTSVPTSLPPGEADADAAVKVQSGKDFATDLSRGKTLQADLYPAHRILDILKEEGPNAFGVGTDQLNTLKNAMVTWFPGQVDEKTIQSVANVGEAKKQLVQLARSNGNSGTNDQLAAAFEGSPNTKMTGATIESVVKSIVALRKMNAALPLMFAQTGRPNGEYSTWVAKNQNKVDPRAFGFDLMDRDKQDKLLNSFTEKENDSAEMKKAKAQAYTNFKNSLQFAHDAQMIGN